MRPDSTIYRLAKPEDDYWLDLLPSGEVPRRFPTVVAERAGTIVGFLATDARADFICAGPLYVDLPEGRHRGVVAVRLIQAYEAVLMHAEGVDGYYYMIGDIPWKRPTSRCENTYFCKTFENGLSLFWRELPPPEQLLTVH